MTTPIPAARRWPYVVALASMVALIGLGFAVFPSAPDPIPVHWNAAFEPDRWAPKSLGLFLAPVWIGAGCVVAMWILAVVIQPTDRSARRAGGTSNAAEATDATADSDATQPVGPPRQQLSPRPPMGPREVIAGRRLLEYIAIGVAGLVFVIACVTWFDVPDAIRGWLAPITITAFLALIAMGAVPVVRASRAPA